LPPTVPINPTASTVLIVPIALHMLRLLTFIVRKIISTGEITSCWQRWHHWHCWHRQMSAKSFSSHPTFMALQKTRFGKITQVFMSLLKEMQVNKIC
jgi:hypothetical protein